MIIKRVDSIAELEGIKNLQQENLKANLSEAESDAEGFVTAEYTLDFLRIMHEAEPSIIAKDGDVIAGYALVAVKSIASQHKLLDHLFSTIDDTIYNGAPLKDSRYVVCGQLCVKKNYRGMGLVQKMYQHFRDCLSGSFDYCVTDVVQTNQRSVKAHLNTGFQVISTLEFGSVYWDIVLWEWRS